MQGNSSGLHLNPITWKGGSIVVDALAHGCPAGYESLDRSPNVASGCAACLKDWYKPDRGFGLCLPCPRGMIQPAAGSATCICPAGYLQDDSATDDRCRVWCAAPAFPPIPSPWSASRVAASIAHPHTSTASHPPAPPHARSPVGTECTQSGVTLLDVPIKPGYFRLSARSMDVRRCPDAAANCTAAQVRAQHVWLPWDRRPSTCCGQWLL